MSKRLRVLLGEIRRRAREEMMTVAEWVRQRLRAVRPERSGRDVGRKLEAIRAAARHSFPTGDIEQMLAEIEEGYGGGVDR